MRGLKKEDSDILEGVRIYYNFIRPHIALNGKSPTEMACINLQLKQNRWESLIGQSSKHKKKKQLVNYERVDMPAIKYSFNHSEMNNWKGRITERLIECYINDVLIPTLRKQGWDKVIFSPHAWFGDEIEENKHRPDKWKLFPVHMEVRFLVTKGLFPTRQFLTVFKKLTNLLENAPDGFLIKIKKTRKTKPLKEAIKEFQLDRWVVSSCDYRERDENEILSVVDGDIEVVEIKSDKATLPSRQKRSYENILREGYVLRFFHVNIVSFEKNEFEIEEKLLTAPNELKTFPTKGKAK